MIERKLDSMTWGVCRRKNLVVLLRENSEVRDFGGRYETMHDERKVLSSIWVSNVDLLVFNIYEPKLLVP